MAKKVLVVDDEKLIRKRNTGSVWSRTVWK